jgi:hypothetical protein
MPWNKGSLGLLTPNLGVGANEEQRERLLELLEAGEPWKNLETQHLSAKGSMSSYIPTICLMDALLTRSPRMIGTSHTTNSLNTTVTSNGGSMIISE